MSAHTPGPWEWVGDSLEGHSDYVLSVGDDGKSYGMHSAVLIESSYASRAEANRLLIAAAPELLAALQSFPGLTDDATVGDPWIECCRAAIAKATGAAP